MKEWSLKPGNRLSDSIISGTVVSTRSSVLADVAPILVGWETSCLRLKSRHRVMKAALSGDDSVTTGREMDQLILGKLKSPKSNKEARGKRSARLFSMSCNCSQKPELALGGQ